MRHQIFAVECGLEILEIGTKICQRLALLGGFCLLDANLLNGSLALGLFLLMEVEAIAGSNAQIVIRQD
ncbi:hypothetical protein D9M71_588080 [compost metagenome]